VGRSGIAVRVEVPRDFLNGIVSGENDTHFVTSDIRNDYYYYSVLDESRHMAYAWKGKTSDGPCFKPGYAIYDLNAPWCVEIWNYLNGTFLKFTPPKFIRFTHLAAPSIAGIYNFTLFVADHTNELGLPDFVHAWNKTLFVPVSMSDNPATIRGRICDDDDPSNTCPPILAKGVVYATNTKTHQIARAYVNQTNGFFNITGLAPGDYQVQASAGIFNGVAYSLSDPVSFPNVQRGQGISTTIHLHRAPQICGQITYENSLTQTSILHSLTDHPYLPKVGFTVLNITVEATDSYRHRYRYLNVSLDGATDTFKILTGTGIKYVGTDPYGTEFAGLPPVGFLSQPLTLNVMMTGYLQKMPETVTITDAPGRFTPPFLAQCNQVNPNPVVMQSGGVITGTIQFWNLNTPETPHNGEVSLGLGAVTDALFGGNIVIQVFDHTGVLRGLAVINGTTADGRTIYTNDLSVRFYVVGFSELRDRSFSGVWGDEDYGLPAETQQYKIVVNIRGYNQTSTVVPVTLLLGGNSTTIIKMIRGGAIQVGVTSLDNRFGDITQGSSGLGPSSTQPDSCIVQGEIPFRFLDLSIPVVARVYFYDSTEGLVGYVERLLVKGVNGVGTTHLQIVFTGMNWRLRDIWFFGSFPTHIGNLLYTLRANTLGYVQRNLACGFGDLTNQGVLSALTRANVLLFFGNEIDVSAPVFSDPYSLIPIPEHDHVFAESKSLNGTLVGAVNRNLTRNDPGPLFFKNFGFGGMMNKTSLTGQGHFFYVAPTGVRYFDYGIAFGNYTTDVPEFGFNRHFTQQQSSLPFYFPDFFLETQVLLPVVSMAKVYQGLPPDLVSGWIYGTTVNETIPLSWVHVTATNSSYKRYAPTLDGKYDGVGALYLPQGLYNITFSVVNYKDQTYRDYAVTWNANYSVLPPFALLCPTAGSVGGCDPPLTISSSPSNSAAGAVVLTASVDLPQGGQNDITYRWSASRGYLNATTGNVVLWSPSDVAGSNATIFVSAVVNVRTGAALLTQNITLPYQAVPEFSQPPIIYTIVLFLTCAILPISRGLRKRKQPI
jgi:hypothetical protein